MTERRGDRRKIVRRRGDRFDRWANRAALGIMVLLVVFGVRSNQHRVEQINQERARNVRTSCEDINSRHDRSIVTLDKLIGRRAGSEEQTKAHKEQIRQSRANTVMLIDTLVPKRDCDVYVKTLVSSK